MVILNEIRVDFVVNKKNGIAMNKLTKMTHLKKTVF